MANILTRVPGIVAGALGGLMTDATISRPTARVPDGRGGFVSGSVSETPCRAIVTDYSDFYRATAGAQIGASDRKAIVLADGLPIIPARGDGFEIEGGDWTVINVVRDPAAATYELQLRPA